MTSHRARSTLCLSLQSLALALLTACATLLPLEPDRQARAPLIQGFGAVTLTIDSPSAEARQWFAQGMSQAYAFNEVEAVRSFKAALARDPGCAMCAWGVAWQLGPIINEPQRGDLKEARRYADYAMTHRVGATPRERALIEAMSLRYATGSQARDIAVQRAPVCGSGDSDRQIDPLELAYAERMHQLADADPEDPDLLAFYAEAEMVATPHDWWDRQSGKPAGRIGEVADRLEAALVRHPGHAGLNHYMIHAVDDVHVAWRAEAAADRLGALAPQSPHLLHMPAHTYAQMGRYADATRVNLQALAADEAMFKELKQQGFDISKDWRGHDGAFAWYGALMEGRGELALETARAAAERAKGNHEFAELQRSRPILTLMRLERWDQVLGEPMPSGDKGPAIVLGELARGTALARNGQTAAAAQALARLEPARAALLKAHPGKDFGAQAMRGIANMAEQSLRAELALALGNFDEALARQAEAVAAAEFPDHAEPPMLAAGTRIALGEMQMRAQAYAAAEQSFRADLAEHPHSGWALQGLARALQAQGRPDEALKASAALDKSWVVADEALRKRH